MGRAILSPKQPGNFGPAARTAQLGEQFDDGLLAVAADAEIGAGAFEQLPGQDREADAAEHNRRIGQGSQRGDEPASSGTNDAPLGQKQSSTLRKERPMSSGRWVAK